MSGGSHANSVSEGTTRFQSLFSVFFLRVAADSCAMRTAWKTLFAVYAVDVPLGLGSHIHSPDRPYAGLKTTGAADCPRVSGHGGYGHVT